MNGTTEAVKTMNSYLDTLVSKVSTIHTAMTAAAEEITAESIKLKYQGKDITRKQFLDVFREHNIQMEALLGNGLKANTLKGYKTSLLHVCGYLEKEFRLANIDTRKIDHAFVTGYEFFLRATMGCSAVSAAKYMKHLRKIIKICIAHRTIGFHWSCSVVGQDRYYSSFMGIIWNSFLPSGILTPFMESFCTK